MYTQFVKPDFGEMHIVDLKRSNVRAFYNHLADSQHVKANTIDNIHTVLHQVLELGVEDDYLRYNPSDNALKELKRAHNDGSEKRRALTVPEQELFEQYLSKNGQYHRWYPIFVVMMWTGMSVGEIAGLRWCDIDLDEEAISVNHTLVYFDKGGSERCGFAVNTPKTKAGERNIPMLPKVKEAFIMEKEYQKECEIACKATVDGYTDFIFINRFGGVQHQGTLNKALRPIIRDCNYKVLDNAKDKEVVTLPRFSNHSLRHTFTTRMCEAGVNIKVMQDILGHADAETTLQIYTDATKDFKKSEMINFEDYFKKQKNRQQKDTD
jgi:integrase